MTDKRLIVVTGATGRQGGGVVDYLLSDGTFRVRATTRNPESAASKVLAKRGVEVVRADFDEDDTVFTAFEGAYGVFGVTDYIGEDSVENEVEQGKLLVDAAKAVGVKHFVWSTLDRTQYHIAHFEAKAIIDDYLKESGIPRTSIYTSWFYENVARRGFPLHRNEFGQIVFKLPLYATDGAIPYLYAADIGGWALHAFKHPKEWIGKDMKVAAEFITPRQMFNIVEDEFGEPVQYKEVTMGSFEKLREYILVWDPPYISYWNSLKYFYETPDARDVELSNQLVPTCLKFRDYVKKHREEVVKPYVPPATPVT